MSSVADAVVMPLSAGRGADPDWRRRVGPRNSIRAKTGGLTRNSVVRADANLGEILLPPQLVSQDLSRSDLPQLSQDDLS